MRSWSLRRPDGVALVGESRGQGEPVVLVHATGMTRRAFAAAADQLARHLRVVTYDRRGWGDSRGKIEPQRWSLVGCERKLSYDALAALTVQYGKLEQLLRRNELLDALEKRTTP